MFIVLARIRRLGALLSDDAELLGRQHGLPLALALLDRVVRHVFLLCRAAEGAEQGAEKRHAGHRAQEGGAVAEGGGELELWEAVESGWVAEG